MWQRLHKKLAPDSWRYQGLNWRTERPVTGSDKQLQILHMRVVRTVRVTIRRTITVRPVRITIKRIS